MHIGILGSGNMGAAIGRALAAKGHTVGFSFSRDPRKLARLASATGSKAFADSPGEVARRSRVIVLAVHWQQVARVLRLAGNLHGKILVDCTNPMNAPATALAVGHRTSGAELVARRAPGARVVKAFNTVPSELLLAGAHVLPERPAVCYCGDDRAAKRSVAALIRAIGFAPTDCGGLVTARYLEPFALLVAELAYNRHRSPLLGVRFLRPGTL
ncbi:MAG: NAD(P)-binding domain-containing protein [Gemmatimonadaceae bacterium]